MRKRVEKSFESLVYIPGTMKGVRRTRFGRGGERFDGKRNQESVKYLDSSGTYETSRSLLRTLVSLGWSFSISFSHPSRVYIFIKAYI